jgi:hypothetical protein
MARKTADVAGIRDAANTMLRDSDDSDSAREGRIGISVLLERILHDTGNYHGFRYLPTDGRCYCGDEVFAHEPQCTGRDETRRAYY